MRKLCHSLLVLIATATDKELARHLQYLKVENQILRSKLPKRVSLTERERQRLIKFGKPLGAAIKQLITIVSPRTFYRWLEGDKEGRKPAKTGRPRTSEDIRELIIRMAKENAWGYTRIVGELRKLGICKISRQTVKNILKEHGLDPGPDRLEGTWDEFLKRHAKTLYQCDFFSVRSWTMQGVVDLYLLVFIHVESRRVWVSPPTAHPDSAWVSQQARNVSFFFDELNAPPTLIVHDRDTKFTKDFDEILKTEGAKIKLSVIRSPNLVAYVERWIQSIKQECLGHFIIFGEKHLHYLVREWGDWYHRQRPHQAKNNLPLGMEEPPEVGEELPSEEIVCQERLGGLLKHYERRAA